jgi:4-hydroxybenzoate polyprenyltransferase
MDKGYGLSPTQVIKDFGILIRSKGYAIFPLTWGAIIACMVIGHGFPTIITTIMAVVTSALVAISVYVYNDVVDIEMDKLNPLKQNRPLVVGKAHKESAILLVILSGMGALFIAFFINMLTFILCLAWLTLLLSYSNPRIRLKNIFLVKEIITSSGFPFSSLVASFALTGTLSLPAVFTGLLLGSFVFLCLPAIADSFDMYEDGIYKVHSLSRALKWRGKVLLLGLAVLFMMTITPLTYARMGFSVLLPIVVVISSLIVIRWGVIPIRTTFDVKMAMRARKIVYAFFLLTQVLIVISSFNLGF